MNDMHAAQRSPTNRAADARMFIAQAYRALLGRAADPVGLESYIELLLAGEMDQAAVIARLVGSDEFASRWLSGMPDAAAALSIAEETVTRIYAAILRRSPEPEARELYAGALALDLIKDNDLVEELLSSEEYRLGEAAVSGRPMHGPALDEADAEIVTRQAYLIHLNRLPDPDGLAWHSARLQEGHVTIQELNNEIRSSPEAIEIGKSRSASPSAAHVSRPTGALARMDAEFVVNHAYLEFLGRQPDASGFAAHVSRLIAAEVSIQQLFAEFEHSPERHARQQQEEAQTLNDARALSLSPQYSAACGDWETYLAVLIEGALRQKKPGVASQLRRLHVVVENGGGGCDEWLATLRSVDALNIDAAVALTASIIPVRGSTWASANIGEIETFTRLAVLPDLLGGDEFSADDLIFWMQAGDTLHPDFAELVAARLGQADLVTVDGWFSHEEQVFPILHPGANATLALNSRLPYSRVGCRGSLILASSVNGLTFGSDLLREQIRQRGGTAGWTHVDLPLVGCAVERADVVAEQRDLADDPQRYQSARSPKSPPVAHVTVVICTKNKGHLLEQLVTSLLITASDRLADVIIVSNNTTSFLAEQALERLQTLSPVVRVVRYDSGFNFSAQSNLGGRMGSGDYVLMLNDDIVPIRDGWLDELLAPFNDADVGIVGPLLLYPDERVQHAGMFVGFSGSAGHALRFARLPDEDYLFTACAPRDVTVVTGAVMMLSREVFDLLNGFDELLASYLQDVDICLRAYHSGFRIVFNPYARLFHMESASVHELLADTRVQANRGREHAYFARRWGETLARDDFHNSLFDPTDESMRRLRIPL